MGCMVRSLQLNLLYGLLFTSCVYIRTYMDDITRVQRLLHIYYYSAFIVERGHKSNIYDVELKISLEPNMSDCDPGKFSSCVVYEYHISTTRVCNLKQLSKYMMWKFQHCQHDVDGVKPIRRYGMFTHLHADIDWIKSVIGVEFDYHVGKRECLKQENAVYLIEYRKTAFAGYGPAYCDVNRPDLNISESKLACVYAVGGSSEVSLAALDRAS